MSATSATEKGNDGAGSGAHGGGGHGPKPIAGLALGAIGVVFGDIGTSPIYALKEAFHGEHHPRNTADPEVVLGGLSIVFWALLIIITVKYVILVMKADNGGEGGILALTSLITGKESGDIPGKRAGSALIGLGLFGTALLYGDGMITPAISVLSAVEGFEVATPAFTNYVVPLAVVIIVALFAVQRFGTGKVGAVFGPIMLVWFAVLAILGVVNLRHDFSVLGAINPVHAFRYFTIKPMSAFLSLGSLFLVVTGGEALYADMGHFGRRPIALGWFSIVMPCLLLNYFGQGALLLEKPELIESRLFFEMAPRWAIVPLALLAVAAAIIASQALISAAFSLTQQAINLGYAPRTPLRYTSSTEKGQIYIPVLNWALMIACVALVVGFKKSTNLAAAYGLAVTATMVITTLLFARVALHRWKWSMAKTLVICVPLFLIDSAFLAANIPKIPYGGWFPLVIAAVVFTQLTTWKKGRALVAARQRRGNEQLTDFAEGLTDERATRPARVRGTAVFMFSQVGVLPPSLGAVIRHHKSLHEHVFVVSVTTADVPVVQPENRRKITALGGGIMQVELDYGFSESPNVPVDLVDLGVDDEAVYFIGRERVHASDLSGMALWRENLFVLMYKNAADVALFFNLPSDRIVEVGTQVKI